MSDLSALISRVEKATGPDRELDCLLDCLRYGREFIEWTADTGIVGYRYKSGAIGWDLGCWRIGYTSSLDAAKALVEELLPGWWWKVGTCSVSDDACVCPDFNDPVHGERLRANYFPIEHGGPYDGGFDVDRRPPGNLPLALIEALLTALIADEERALPSQGDSK